MSISVNTRVNGVWNVGATLGKAVWSFYSSDGTSKDWYNCRMRAAAMRRKVHMLGNGGDGPMVDVGNGGEATDELCVFDWNREIAFSVKMNKKYQNEEIFKITKDKNISDAQKWVDSVIPDDVDLMNPVNDMTRIPGGCIRHVMDEATMIHLDENWNVAKIDGVIFDKSETINQHFYMKKEEIGMMHEKVRFSVLLVQPVR